MKASSISRRTAAAFPVSHLLLLSLNSRVVSAFSPPPFLPPAATPAGPPTAATTTTTALDAIGIFFGTSTGSTEDVADKIKDALGGDDVAEGPFDVESMDPNEFGKTLEKYDGLIVGTPTWNTGADEQRSGTGWDDLYYGPLTEDGFTIENKPVAVFGCGDQVSYAENFADATGELWDVFQKLGADVKYGHTSQEGYEHEASKSIKGDDNKFCGLLCDQVNQEEMTDQRIQNWVEQLKSEGFLDDAAAGGVGTTPTTSGKDNSVATEAAAAVDVDVDVDAVQEEKTLEDYSSMFEETIKRSSGDGASSSATASATTTSSGFKPYYNEKTGSTMFVSTDGRSCYYTSPKTASAVAEADPARSGFSP